jgi:hypothetical protein
LSPVPEAHVDAHGVGGTEPRNDDVLPRLALWLAEVSAEAALTPLKQPARPDDPPNPEPAPE